MIVDPQTGQVVGEPSVVAGVSEIDVGVNRTVGVGRQGTASALFLNTPDAQSDSNQFRIFLLGRNGLGARNNLGTINALVNLSIDRQGGVQASGVTKRFPSIEGFAYKIVQGELVIEVLFANEERDPNDLLGRMDEPLRE